MNIEIANRLVKLRKENNLSQEALANKLGISRQAVSKWERAEASPDTDNLIMLAKIYDISLDDLLKTDQEEFESAKKINQENDQRQIKEKVHISFRHGIHVLDKDGTEVHVGWNGIHIDDVKNNEKVDINNWDDYMNKYYINHTKFPVALIVFAIYIIAAIYTKLWHPLWIMLLVIPIIDGAIAAIKNRDLNRFPYPILVTLYYLYEGFFEYIWSPTWIVFLTIPVYYGVINYYYYYKTKQTKQDDV